MRVPAFLALLCWVACASAWECDENAEHLTAVDIKIKSHEDHVIYGQLHACPRAGEELSQNLRFRFQNPRNIILDQETGSFQYSPDREHFSGVDNFVYTVEDEVERSEPASVFISLRPQPDEPRLQVQHVQGNEGEVIPLHIQAQLEDQDGSETLTVTLCNCGQEVSCKSDKCRCQLSVPSGWHFLAGGQRVHRRNLNKLTQDQANQLSVRVPENSHGQYCFGVHATSVEQKGKGHVNAQTSQDMHITVHSRNQPPTITHHSKTETLRWCTISSQEQQKCQEMSRAFSRRLNHRLECVQGQSSEDCMYKISNNMADVITLDGGDIYTAGSKYNLLPVMGEDYGHGDASYWAVAVVRKDNPEINMNNLRGRKSCHTGIGKTSGWNLPVGWLIQNNHIQVDNRRSIPQTVGSFFSKSCVPGAQSPEYNPDGTNPESLCSLCVGEGENRCVRNTNEPYYGYSGAFRCLVEGAGDVAFVNHVTVYENTNSHSEEEWTRNLDEDDFELLCPDGSRGPWHQYKECNLARVPAHAVMTSYHSQKNLQQIVEVLNQAQQHFGVEGSDDFEMFDSSEFEGRDLLFRDNVHRLVPVGQRNTWQKWLGSSYMESVGHLISHDQERNQRVLNKQIRWCATSEAEMDKCEQMSKTLTERGFVPTIKCVQADNADQCMQMIHMNQADVITLDGGDIYQSGMKYNMRPIMGEDYGNGDASYWAVAVVRKDNPEINMNNLRGRKSCHTGIGKTSGWNVPVGWLIQNNQIQVDNRRSIPQTVGSFFSKSCVPGAQSPEYNPDGSNPESLCSLCVGEGENRCVRNTNEPYYGYSGAFRCLVEGAGEVAFVNHVTVYENTNGHSEEEWTRNLDEDDFELLCPDGSRRPWSQYKECNLARVPSHAVMTSPRSRTDIQQIVNFLQLCQDHFGFQSYGDFEMFDSSRFGGRDLLFRDNVQRLVPVGQRNTWQKWLGSSYMESVGHLISHDQERNQRVLEKQVRWCVTSDAEMEKCEVLSRVQKQGVAFPTVQCVQADNADQCMQMIHMNQADVITLDGGDIYQAGMKYNMRPIMGEDYGNGDASYWAVAVVRKDNPEINMNNLRGRKSCHTGLGKTAGWIIPTGWLVDQDFVQTDGQTSLVQAVGHFFSKSCVPGAKSPEYDPQNTNPSTLCSLCAGAGEDHCVRNKNEPYYGYSGAFRCLAEGAGDVAFINHQTVQDNTDGHNPENWAAGLHADDFELLCTDGSRRPVDQWRECSLARVPSHAVMTSEERNQEWVDRAVQLLKNTQEMFGSDGNERGFSMFDSSSFSGHDLLFRDDTQHLVEVGSKDSWEKWLGQEYLRCIRTHHAVEPVQPHSTLRWCTISSQEQQKCQEMSHNVMRNLNHRLECVQGQSSEDCMYKISNNQADVITLDGGDIYTAGSQYNLVPVMGEDYGNGDASYWAVAVVRKDDPEINMNNLRGRKSCHTGIGKTSGWNVPVGWLIQNNQIQVDNRRSIPQTVGSFFSKSCVPGAQSPEYNPDGTNPESLCSLCVGERENRCVRNTNEPYYGYSGAFRCLVEGAGDVAFVNHVTVYENTNGHSEEEWTRNLDEDDFELLCPDGSRRPWNQYKECNLARVPSHAVMTSPRSRTDIQQIVDFLQLCQDHFGFQSYGDFEMFDSSKFGGRDLLFRDNVQRLVPVGQRNTWQKWLGSGYMESVGHLISHDQERNHRVLEKQVRWCVTSDAEMEKCQVLSRVQKQGVAFPTVQCVQADNADQCMQMIHMNQADVITLDGGDIYQAGMRYNMRPIMGEDYGNGDASYWAVAVVRKDNPEINMNNLRGRKSCHTGLGKTAGWIIPTGWLVDQDFVQTDGQTSLVQAVGHFFSKSCVPGAKSPEYDPQNTNPSTLCSLCAGAGEDHCVRNKNEPYYGYSGAFRCLAEGAGDVAFINHQTVQDNTDGHNPENWAAGLRADDFELLCTDGSRRPVDQWRECSLARVPSHAVMTSNDRSQEWVNRVVQWLKNTQEQFGSDENENEFQLFDSSSFGGHDLLFRDDTQHLVEVGSKDSWEKWLGQEYLRCIRSHHDVEPVQPHSTLRWCTISSQEQQKCQEMSRAFSRRLNHRLECVQGQSSEDCMYKISNNQADVITLDGGDILTAGSKYNLVPVMGEDYGNGDASYWAVAVARINNPEINMNNLRGRKSCHTGIGKTSGWNVPVGWMIQNNQIQLDNKKSIPQAVGRFFSKSCVPGAQSPEYNPDGTNPESLCSLCVGEGENRCVRNTNEPYYGYSGAFRCLVEGAGEVAFVNHQTIFENTNGRSEEEWTRNLHQNDFELLCPDGSRKQWNQYKECNLARVPSHAVMTSPRSRTDIQQIVNILTQAQEHFGQHSDFQMFDSSKFGGRDLLFRDNVQRLVPVGQRNTWQKWLGSSYLTSIRSMIHRDEQRTQRVLDKQVRWCVTSEAEKQKCERMSSSLDSYDFVTFPTVKCVQADNADQCMQMIHMNQADVITLDGGDIYQAGMKYNMRPIMGEDYGNGDASYWAVAVVRKDNPEINMNNLRGRKSCHTGLGKTAGWIIPTGWLVDQDFVQTDGQTSLVQAVGHFFSKSCVPGAKSPEYDPQNTNPSTLCSLCAGAGEDHCVRNKNEPYYGYAGAFRCLAEGAGDVAFINHQTVQDNTDGHNPENWAAGLHADDFELLCTDGSRRPVDQWRECSLARVPSHTVMTSNDRSQEWVNRVVRLLKGVQEQFASDENENDFQLFDSSSFGGHDLLFRDDTQHLVEVGSKDSWEKWLGQEYLRCIRSHHTDTHSSSGQQLALSTSEGRPVLLSNLRIQDAEGHNGRYHVHATVNQGGHLWVRDGLDSIVFTSDAKSKTTNQHDTRHHRHQDSHQRSEESELSREDSSSQEHPRRHPRSHESHSQERNHQDSNPLSHMWDSLWKMWDSSDERQHSSEESHRDMAWHDVHTSTEKERQELTMDDDFYQHYKHHHFQYSKNGRPSLSFSGDLAAVQKALSSLVFVPWCQQWPTPPNWDLPPTTWMFPSEEDQTRSEDPNHPVIWPAWYPRFWYPFPTKSWTWWPRVLPPYWLNQQCQDWTSMIHISVSEEAPSSCASRQDRRDRPVTDMDIPVHVQSRTNGPISLIPKNLFYYFDSEAESVPINDIHIRSQLTDVNLHLKFNVIEDHLATVQAESVEAPEFTCTSVEECNEHLRTVKVHFRNGVRATDICHLGIQISMFKDNSDVPSDLLTVWAYQTSGRCVDPWATNSNFHLSNERSHTNQGQTVDINLIPEDLSNEESLNGILHVTVRAPHGLVTYTAPDGLRTFVDHMGVRQRIPTNLCLSGPAEMVKQALQTVRYTPIRAFTGTDSITIEYGTTRTAMRLSPDKIHPRMTVVHKVEVRPVSSPILVQAPSHMCVNQQQRPLPHIDSNLELQSMWHKPAPNMVKLTVTATSGDVNINQHKLQQEFHPSESSQEHHQDMVHLDLDVEHRQRPSGSWLQVTAEDWVVRHILHNQLVWYKPNKCVSSQQPIQHDTIHVEVEEVKSEHVTSSEIQVTVDCHQPQQQRWQVDGVSSSEQQSQEQASSEWSLELSPWSVEQSSSEAEVTSDSECTPTEPWNDWSECDADSCQMGSQWRERRTRNTNPASNRYCQPQRETRQCTNCGCKPVRQFVKHPAPSFQDCQTVRQVPRCPETCRPTKTSFAEEQFDCRGRTLNKDVLIHEACACVECAVKHTKESWHSSERQPSSNERWSDELGFPWY
ncbi:PREDICTED: uncharacterized protein LOC109471661 isoform X1 [Branchiostoma belcheri]|uniref:Serotransferrin n=1 Tax=Branchiostoma belcheri TaxID=7741 RepID=A0A6P4YBR4_BRABE|nr:PREDICTED: uncharacterized protein LOC109471661 isoform X1 [Branchiostoma belcheri]